MTEALVDASVAVKWFKADDEQNVPEALALLAEATTGEVRLLGPDLLQLEVVNALRFEPMGAGELAMVPQDLAGFGVAFLRVDGAVVASAARLARDLGMSVYDATYLALAVDLGCPLITADRKAFEKMRGVGDVRLLGADPLPL